MNAQIPVKTCKKCKTIFAKKTKESARQWQKREFCSKWCVNKGRIKSSLVERFMSKVEIITESGCWIWIGALDGHGYGHLATEFKKPPEKAYRVSYELFIGEIKIGLVVRHKCDIPCCVNPNHLEIGTQKDNVGDMIKRGRMNPKSLLNLRGGSMLKKKLTIAEVLEKSRFKSQKNLTNKKGYM